MKKLIACLACRNSGSRLYGKPLQNLDIKNNISILDYIISYLKKSRSIDEIVLGVAEGTENDVYHSIAKKHNISSISGDEKDVLSRLIKCCKHVNGTDVFRVTSESPFCLYEYIDNVWLNHREKNFDLSTIDNVPNSSVRNKGRRRNNPPRIEKKMYSARNRNNPLRRTFIGENNT